MSVPSRLPPSRDCSAAGDAAPLRVLYLVPDLLDRPGGIARYCRMVSAALLEGGAELTVVALHDDLSLRATHGPLPPATAYISCGGSRLSFLRHAIASLRRRPSLIVLGHPNFSTLGFLLAPVVRAKVVTFMYGVDAWRPLSMLRRQALQRAGAWIAISDFTARRAAAVNRLPCAAIRVLPNCVDPVFAGTDKARVDRDFSLLAVSRLDQTDSYKGFEYVLRALPGLLQRFPGLTYDIVGDGNARQELEILVSESGLDRAVRFYGSVSDEVLSRLYASASLFVMPSRGEGFGFVFLEAMAHGLPVVAGNADATPEVVVDGETGYLVDPTSVEAIAGAVGRLLGDERLRRWMGANAVRHVNDNFTFAQFQQRLLSYLADISSSAPGRPQRAAVETVR